MLRRLRGRHRGRNGRSSPSLGHWDRGREQPLLYSGRSTTKGMKLELHRRRISSWYTGKAMGARQFGASTYGRGKLAESS